MEFKIKRNEFLECMSRAQGIVEKRSNMPILSTVLISAKKNKIKVFATDLELSFQQTIPAEVISEGSITLPGRKLFEILREGKGEEFHIREEENQRIFISDGSTKFKLASLPPEDFPLLTEPENVKYTLIEGSALKDMIKKTIYAVTSEDIGFKLSGVFIEKKEKEGHIFLRFVATDGHRLSMIDKIIPGIEALNMEEGILVPKKGITEINKFALEGGSIEIGLKDQNFIAKKGDRSLIIRLLDAKFPNYENVIPDKLNYLISINKTQFVDALRRMLIISTERYKAVRIILKKNSIELISTNLELGEAYEAISVEYKDKEMKEEIEIAFNPKFFIDAIQPLESEFVILGFIDKNSPCIIRGDDDPGFLALIMPMRL